MAQWGSIDQANNSVVWGVATVNKVANSANRTAFYANTTANSFIAGETIGQFGINAAEVAANKGIAHTGWVVRTVGQGGRANRVSYEVLVAGGISALVDGDANTVSPNTTPAT